MDEEQALDQQPNRSWRGAWLLGLIWLIGVGLDRLWLRLDHAVPDAAQSQILNQLLDWSQPHPGRIANPLFYAVAAVVQQCLGQSPDQLLWTQALFSGLLLLGINGLGQRLFSPAVGLWAAGLALLLPALLVLRLRFSLDLSLVAMVTVSLWRLVVWRQMGQSPALPLKRSITPTAAPADPAVLPWERELQLLRQTIVRRTEASMPGRWSILDRGLLPFRTRWAKWRKRLALPPIPLALQPWANAIVLGGVLGLTGLTHPLALIYLVVPFTWSGLVQLLAGQWWRWCQWVLAGLISWTIAWPGYRRNLPEFVLMALRSPRSLGPDRWHWDGAGLGLLRLADQLFYPLLLVGLLGLLLYHQRAAAPGMIGRQSVTSAAVRLGRRQQQRSWWRAVGSLILWIVVPLLIVTGLSLNDLALLPVIPLAIILLAQGLLLFPRSFFQIRWMILGLIIVWTVSNLLPIVPLRSPQQLAQPPQNWHQTELLQTVIQDSPGLVQTIGVLPQTAPLSADYLNYFARSHQLPIIATTVGLDQSQVWPDRRMLPWYLLKTGEPGASTPGNNPLTQALRRDAALQLAHTWPLPGGEKLELWQRRQPVVQVTPIVGAQWSEDLPIQLEKVQIPAQAMPGQPIPVVYTWAGRPPDLQAGLVEITWRRVSSTNLTKAPQPKVPQPKAPQEWWHDHGIGLGQLRSLPYPAELMQVTETLATIAPAGATGRYRLEATYLNPVKGERYPLVPPDVSIELVAAGRLTPPATAKPATDSGAVPELDLLTQGRTLAQGLMQSANVTQWQTYLARLDRYDPTHQTLDQWRQLTRDRLEAEPNQLALYPDLALVQFLQGDMLGTIATLERLIERSPRNPQLPLYLAIAEATAGNAAAARSALNQLPPTVTVPDPLLTLIAALKGQPLAQWQLYRLRLDGMRPSYRRMN